MTDARSQLRPSGRAPSFGFVAPHARADVEALEAAGTSSFWVGGHLASPNPTPEAMVWLARLVEQTQHAILGTAALLLPLYPPAIVAKQVADLDRESGGRLALGIGVGGEHRSDFDAVEVPIVERGSRTNEAVPLLRRFWSGEPVTHHGRHHDIVNVRIHPTPEQAGGPPIVVTGRRPAAMRRAARLGDGWMPYLYSPERYARSVAVIREEAVRVGRDLDDFRWFAYVFVSLDDDPSRARATAVDFLGGAYGDDFGAMIDRVAVTGDVGRVTARLAAFIDAGVEHFVLAPCGHSRVATAHRLLGEVLPALR